LTLVGLLALWSAACGHEQVRRGPAATAAPARTVSTAEVERSGDSETTVPASVQARQRAALSARIPASVLDLPHREGERVEAGAVLVRLDDGALRSALTAAEAAEQAAGADQARIDGLLEKGAATSREADEANARAAGARATRQAARDSLAYAVLRAPFSGVVASRPVNVGDVVSPGRTLIEIVGQGGYEVVATLDSNLASTARVGAPVKVAVDGQTAPLQGTIRALSPAGDPSTHRFEVRADLPSAAGLRSGLFARLLLPTAASDPRLSVPKSAVFERGGLSGVFVVQDGKARLRWIAVGTGQGQQAEVRAGLVAGERVVLNPQDLTDGAPVQEKRQ
jgi:RND family efflux transporter MFP subunit